MCLAEIRWVSDTRIVTAATSLYVATPRELALLLHEVSALEARTIEIANRRQAANLVSWTGCPARCAHVGPAVTA